MSRYYYTQIQNPIQLMLRSKLDVSYVRQNRTPYWLRPWERYRIREVEFGDEPWIDMNIKKIIPFCWGK